MSTPPTPSPADSLAAASADADSSAGSGNVGNSVQTCGPQVSPVPASSPAPAVGDLVVTVINDDDNSKVSGISVQIAGPQSATAQTDGSGVATFSGIASGAYTVSHSSTCFTSASANPTVTAAATTPAELHVCHIHAVLAIKELAFSGNNVVEKDTTGNFASPEWQDGRGQADQAPVAYSIGKKISFAAKFKVSTAPCQAESVAIKGTASFGSASLEWTGSVTVNPGDTEVSVSLTSNNAAGSTVGIFESSDISWQMNPGNLGFAAAGTTRNVLYVTLGDPSGTPNYWTLLDISCRAAAGQTTASGVIANSFNGFTGRAISRKRDGQGLTYWNPSTATCTNTALLLAAADGAGQCGSWAEFLIDMYKVHGITTAEKILIVRTVAAYQASSEGFLVKHWVFDHPPASAASAYTHFVPSQCRTGVGLPGQRNASPPPAFYNHFIVRADGRFWDPSYGAGPFADQSAWENAAIDGLFRAAPGGAPPGNSLQTGFDKSLNAATNILEFWSLTTNSKI